MEPFIHILHLEDDPADAELVQARLESAGLISHITHVQTGDAFGEALGQGCYDVILADFGLPGYDGLSALRLAQVRCPEVPFIFVSGVMGEEAAIEGLTEGATDYVLKQKLSRLVPALKRALHEAENWRERRRAEAKANQLAAIVQSSEDAIIGKTLDGIITSWNKGAEKIYSYAEHEVMGQPISLLIPPGRAGEMAQLLEQIKLGEHIEHYETVRRRKDGREIHMSLTISPIRDAQGVIVAASTIGRDITERKHAEEALRATARYTRNLIEASLDPLVTIGPNGKITDVNAATETAIGCRREELIGTDFCAYFTDPGAAQAGYQQAFEAGLVRDYPLEIRHRDGRTTPVLYNATVYRDEAGQVSGVFAAARDITERQRAEAELAQRAAQLALINDIGSQIAAMLELQGVLERAARLVQAAFGYHHVALFLLEGEVARLKAIAGSYQSYFPAAHYQPLSQGIIGWVGRQGEKVVANDVSRDSRYISNIADRTVTQAELCLPIKVAGRMVGVLDIQSPRLNTFGENDVIAMETLTHQIAIAIENARLYEAVQKELVERKQAETETRRRNRELALFNQVIAASAVGLEPEALLNIACRELTLAFDLPQATAVLLNEAKTEWNVVAEYLAAGSTGRPGENQFSMLNQVYPVVANSVWQHLLTHRSPLVVADTPHDPRLVRFQDLLNQRRIVSLLLLPLLIEEQAVGALILGATEPHPFTTEDVNLAWRVTDQVAGALAQARLRQTRERLSTAVEQAAESVVITATDGSILYVNPAFEHTSGYSRAEIIGQNSRILQSGRQDRAFYARLWATLTAGQTWQGYLVNKKKDGTLYTEDVTIGPVRNERGAIVNYVAVKRDVTREVELEEQYRQAQKLEAVGQLAGGVAHDFNNILVAIIGYSDLLLRGQFDGADSAREYLEEIKIAGQRAAGLTRQLLAFSRKQLLQPRILDLNELVANLEKMLRRLIREDIELVTRLAPRLGQVKADPGQIEQILVNLVVNARDAMPSGGQLLIETANAELDEVYAGQHQGTKPGRYVLLAVSDTGVGMDAAIQARIFEPFFTTKEVGQGTGLGLATVYGIVKQSGGDIWVYSEPGQGATFKIYLPRLDEPIPVVAVQPPATALPGGAETVLLVEDDEGVRTLARSILELSGYIVLDARHGSEALRLGEQERTPIDLLVTDVVMPGGLNGRELAERLSLLYPKLKVLYISGYTDNAILHREVLETGMHFLQKPFTPHALAQKVRQVLEMPPRTMAKLGGY